MNKHFFFGLPYLLSLGCFQPLSNSRKSADESWWPWITEQEKTCKLQPVSIISIALIVNGSFRSDDLDWSDGSAKHLSDFAKKKGIETFAGSSGFICLTITKCAVLVKYTKRDAAVLASLNCDQRQSYTQSIVECTPSRPNDYSSLLSSGKNYPSS